MVSCYEKGIINNVKISKFKTISISAVIRMPLEREYVTFNALLPSVLKRGCKKYNTIKDINIKTYEMFGAVFDANVIKKGEEQILQFFIEIVDKNGLVEKAVEFLADILLNPLIENKAFIKSYVDTEKENLKSDISGRKNNKKEYAKLKCIELMCEDEPFGIYGDGYEEDINKINPKNLYDRYCYIIDNFNIEFYSVGNLSEEKLKSLVDEYFKLSPKKVLKFNQNKTFLRNDVKKVKESEGLSQGKLCIGMRTDVKPDSDDFYALLAANEIFGGSANSKLFLKLREENGLCYYINSFVYRFKSIISVQAGIKEEDYEKSVSMIRKCIEDVQDGNFEKKNFDSAILGLIKSYESIVDYPQGLMDFNLTQNMLCVKDDLKTVSQKLKNVSMKDVSNIMKMVYVDTIYFLC